MAALNIFAALTMLALLGIVVVVVVRRLRRK